MMNKTSVLSAITVATILAWVAQTEGKTVKPFVENAITNSPGKPIEMIIEAEDFDGLKIFPDFHREAAQGWYTKEHTHASGRAFAVCDSESESASMLKVFDSSLPAGDYLLGVRAVLMRWQNGMSRQYGHPCGNILKIELGNCNKGVFEPVGAMSLNLLYGSGYGFTPYASEIKQTYRKTNYGTETRRDSTVFVDPVIKAMDKWNAIRLTAARVVAGGIGDVPEFGLPYIALDQIKISNVPGYLWRNSHSGRINLLLAREIAEREKERAARQSAKETESTDTPEIPEPEGNLIADGSFEAGGRPWWTPALVDNSSFTFDPQNIKEGKCPHGKRYARIMPRQNGVVADEKEGSIRVSAHIRSKAFRIGQGEYVARFQARSKAPGKVKLSLGDSIRKCMNKTFETTPDWQSFSMAFTSAIPTESSVFFSVTGNDSTPAVDIDAVELVREEQLTDAYMEAEGTAMRIACPAPYATYHDDKPVSFDGVVYNSTDKKTDFSAEWRIKDITGRIFESGTLKMEGGPGVTRKSFEVKFKGYGNFILSYTMHGKPPVLVPFSRIQNPAHMEKGSKRSLYLGVLGRNIREATGDLLRYYGVEFKTDLNDYILRANSNTYGYRKHYTYRNEIEKMLRSGMKWIPWIWNGEPPPYDHVVYSSGPAPHGGRPWMSDSGAAWYFRDTLKRYKGLYADLINVNDEFSNQRAPRDGFGYFPTVYKTIKSVDPKLGVMASVEAPAAEVIDKHLGGTKGVWADWLGGSRYGAGKWHAAREQCFLEKAGTKFWVDGVGWPNNRADLQFFNSDGTVVNGAYTFHLLNKTAWDVAILAAINRPDRFSCYTTKYGNGASDPYNQFALYDGRFTPVAMQWLTTCQFFRDTGKGRIVVPEDASNVEILTFEKDGEKWAALYGNAPLLYTELTIPVTAAKLKVLDHHLMERKPVASGNNSLVRIKRGEILFVGTPEPEFHDKLAGITAKDLIEVRFALISKGDVVECVACLKNNMTEPLTGSLTLYEDMLRRKEPEAFEFNLAPGSERVFRKPQDKEAFEGRAITYYPVHGDLAINGFLVAKEAGPRKEELQEKEGMGMKSGAFFWTHYAMALAEGQKEMSLEWLDEWQTDQGPVGVGINWGMNGSYQQSQVRQGAENTDFGLDQAGYMEHDYASLHYVRHDSGNLYLGALIEDDPAFPPKPGVSCNDYVVYTLQPELAEHLGDRNPDNLVKVKVVQTANDVLKATLLKPDGTEKELKGICRSEGKKRRYIVQLPLSDAGFKLRGNDTLGFDVTCFDSDEPGGKIEAEYDWSGAGFATGDAFGFGQLIVK